MGRLEVPGSLVQPARDAGFELLSITPAHVERASGLPAHGDDPFDRILVAQALEEGCVLVTRDAALGAFVVPILPA